MNPPGTTYVCPGCNRTILAAMLEDVIPGKTLCLTCTLNGVNIAKPKTHEKTHE